MWSLNDLMMMIDDRESLNKTDLKAALYYAGQHLSRMDKELRDLRPIGEAVKRLAIQAVGISNG